MSAVIHDVAIVGGGLVGCSLAVALAAQGRRIALIEAVAPRAETACWDERCIGLNAGSRAILDSLGLWDELSAQAEPIVSTHISERGRFGTVRFAAQDAGLAALGFNTPLRAINEVLWKAVAASANIRVLCPARLDGVEVDGDTVTLALDAMPSGHPVAATFGGHGLPHVTEDGGREVGPQPMRARLLVAADGARSAVRALLGLHAETRDYQQSAIVTAVRPQHPHQGVAYERFLPGGPLAVLPKPDDADGHACSLVWTVPATQVDMLTALDDSSFLAAAADQFGERLGRFRALGRRQSYRLSRVMSTQLCAPRTVFAGNAAQSLHPVAAQGFNLGLRDAATLAELLESTGDPGDGAVLREYQNRRSLDRRRTADFTDRLVHLFSNSLPGLRGLRHLGLSLLDLDTPAREAVLRHNLGYGGPVPRLARALR